MATKKSTRAVVKHGYRAPLVVREALRVLEGRMRSAGPAISCAAAAHHFAALQLAERKAEVFAVMLLDTRSRLIEYRELFFGTISTATVYPREVLRAVMDSNAAGVILIHNHPSGNPEPSDDDKAITRKLEALLGLIDTKVIDHVVIGGTRHASFAERGLLGAA